ncbi:ATP-grasp domain-containing protein [Paenibacillus sp. SYP-B3998]|uniref:ATP-grasp domain-containing protein n=1 Tax=Paenibacillus sp. SYP-B3998 TaxID=2678564 RepID=A0A6G3ZX94_9BACL|nr:ATP-grasp domain-containing protein [Paenibacillus sp. SYP-B3998]NEW06700.1 ATP-grasp domain-containing protein [Paenibacillus sp. SYP-B3998]
MSRQKIVAFVEPSFYGVSFVKVAYDQGSKVIAIVSSKENPQKYGYEGIYHDLIVADIRDEQALYEAITNSDYNGQLDALIPATDYASHLTAKVAERLGLKGVPYEAALKSRNKDLAREAYEEHGVPGAKFKKVKTYEEAESAAAEIGYPVVLKPTNCASSQNVSFINNASELKKAMTAIVDFKVTYMDFKVREDYLIEEYLEGQEFSVELFLKDGKPIFSAVTEKVTSPLPYFVEILHTLPTSVYQEEQEDIINTAVSALKAIGLHNGPSHVEVKLSQKGARIIEVNGRPGGDNIASDLLVQAFGFDIFEATVNYYLDLPINSQPSKRRASSIAYLTASQDGIVTDIQGLDQLQISANVIRSHISVKPGDLVSVARSSDDRLGYVITVGDTPQEAKTLALELIQKIKLSYKEGAGNTVEAPLDLLETRIHT